MRRRAARGGRATPPLHSDDNDREQEGRSGGGDAADRGPTHSEAEASKGSPGCGDEDCSGSAGGLVNHIQNSDTVVVGGANGDHSDVAGGVNDHSNSALNRLTMDAYGSSDED